MFDTYHGFSFKALARISAILKYQTQELDFMSNLLMRKINAVNQSIEILRFLLVAFDASVFENFFLKFP
jgi:hypothetical protein